jgi:hypothetical protein
MVWCFEFSFLSDTPLSPPTSSIHTPPRWEPPVDLGGDVPPGYKVYVNSVTSTSPPLLHSTHLSTERRVIVRYLYKSVAYCVNVIVVVSGFDEGLRPTCTVVVMPGDHSPPLPPASLVAERQPTNITLHIGRSLDEGGYIPTSGVQYISEVRPLGSDTWKDVATFYSGGTFAGGLYTVSCDNYDGEPLEVGVLYEFQVYVKGDNHNSSSRYVTSWLRDADCSDDGSTLNCGGTTGDITSVPGSGRIVKLVTNAPDFYGE